MSESRAEAFVTVFVDANVLIHFRTFDEVDWPTVLGTEQVQLILVPTVMRELNKYKDDSSNEGKRDRIRAILAKLKALLRSAEVGAPVTVRDNVTLIDIAHEPVVDWGMLRLDPHVEDDRVLASIVEYRTNNSGPVILVTNDFLLQRKATVHGISTLDPDGHVERHELISPEARRAKHLEQQLQQIAVRTPRVSFGFWEAGKSAQMVHREPATVASDWQSDAEIESELVQIRQHFDCMVQAASDVASGVQLKKFRYDCKKYVASHRFYLLKQRAKRFGHRYTFGFVLENVGTAPVEGVSIVINFPEGSFIVAIGDEENDYYGFGVMEPPNKPEAPWLRNHNLWLGNSLLLHQSWYDPPISRAAREPKPEGPLYIDDFRAIVEYRHPKLRHGEDWRLPALAAYILPIQSRGFGIACTVRADNLPSPIDKRLDVAFREQAARFGNG